MCAGSFSLLLLANRREASQLGPQKRDELLDKSIRFHVCAPLGSLPSQRAAASIKSTPFRGKRASQSERER